MGQQKCDVKPEIFSSHWNLFQDGKKVVVKGLRTNFSGDNSVCDKSVKLHYNFIRSDFF